MIIFMLIVIALLLLLIALTLLLGHYIINVLEIAGLVTVMIPVFLYLGAVYFPKFRDAIMPTVVDMLVSVMSIVELFT